MTKIKIVKWGKNNVGNPRKQGRSGGGRKPSKPDYNPQAALQKQVKAAVSLYGADDHPSLQIIADQLSLNSIKVRKLLITAGVYESEIADEVQEVFRSHIKSGLSHVDAIAATMKELNLSKASVTSYLPYEKGVYFPQETDGANLSVGAERVRRMRKRKIVFGNLLAVHIEFREQKLFLNNRKYL